MPSSDFQKIVRDLANISEKLEIKSVGDELIFKCAGQYAKAEIRRTETQGSMQFVQKLTNGYLSSQKEKINLLLFLRFIKYKKKVNI